MVNYTRMVLTHLNALNIEPPQDVTAAAESVNRIRAGLTQLTSPGAVEAAVVDALTTGRDPLDDDTVRRAALAKSLATADLTRYIDEAEHRVTAALRTARPAIHERLTQAHAAAAARLKDAMTALRMPHLDHDKDAILTRGEDAARHYVTAREANDTIDTIGSTINVLAHATGGAPITGGNLNILHAADISADLVDALDLRNKKQAWELVRLGLTLTLADPAEYKARNARIASDRAAAQQRAHDRMTGRNTGLIQNPFLR